MCQLVNQIRPGTIPKVYGNSTQYFYIENTSNFLKALESTFGVSNSLMFSAPDLAEGKNPRTVIFLQIFYHFCIYVSIIRYYRVLLISPTIFDMTQNTPRSLHLFKKMRYHSLVFKLIISLLTI